MGWVKSPPAFCAGTETIADLANTQSNCPLPKHPLEDAALTRHLALPSLPSPMADIMVAEETLAPPPLGYHSRPTPKHCWPRHHDIHVDDCVSLVQGSTK